MPKINVNNIKEKAVAAKNKAVDAVAKGGEHVKNQAIKAKQDIDKMICKPLWPSDIEQATFVLPSLIHVTDDDPKTQKEACKGAVAFDEGNGEKKALTVLTEYAEKLPVTFYPNLKEGIYYVDPYRKDYYIDLNDYFQYFKNAKVHELNEIAQDLGAKYIKISVAAEKKVFARKGAKAGIGIGKGPKANLNVNINTKNFESSNVVSESKFKGHEAKQPTIKYFKHEQDILSLIDMRMNPDNPLTEKTITFKYSNSSGIKEAEALKIDSILKKLKFAGNASISKEVEEENRLYFEYTIEFPQDN